MVAATKDFTWDQGADRTLSFVIKTGSPAVAQDLTGYTGTMQVRRARHRPILAEANVVIGDQVSDTGRFTVTFDSVDTDKLPTTSLKYDIYLKNPDNKVSYIMRGTITVVEGITRV